MQLVTRVALEALPLVLLHGVVLVLKHRVFGSEMEYRDRIARLREQKRLQEYGRYEDDK